MFEEIIFEVLLEYYQDIYNSRSIWRDECGTID